MNNEANQVDIAATGGISVIIAAMKTHSDHPAVNQRGCQALVNISWSDAKIQHAVKAAGGVAVAHAAKLNHVGNAGVQKQTVALLHIFQ